MKDGPPNNWAMGLHLVELLIRRLSGLARYRGGACMTSPSDRHAGRHRKEQRRAHGLSLAGCRQYSAPHSGEWGRRWRTSWQVAEASQCSPEARASACLGTASMPAAVCVCRRVPCCHRSMPASCSSKLRASFCSEVRRPGAAIYIWQAVGVELFKLCDVQTRRGVKLLSPAEMQSRAKSLLLRNQRNTAVPDCSLETKVTEDR
jgi:hypothetical protein